MRELRIYPIHFVCQVFTHMDSNYKHVTSCNVRSVGSNCQWYVYVMTIIIGYQVRIVSI